MKTFARAERKPRWPRRNPRAIIVEVGKPGSHWDTFDISIDPNDGGNEIGLRLNSAEAVELAHFIIANIPINPNKEG